MLTTNTHTIGFSALISGISRLIGYSSRLANLLSGLCWIFTVQCLWSACGAMSHRSVARAIALGLLLSSPAMYVVGGTSFAEPLFGLLLMLCIWQTIYRRDEGEGGWSFGLSLALWCVSLLLLALAKKEGVLFIGIMSVRDAVQYWRDRTRGGARHIAWATSSTVALVAAIGVFGLLEALSRHSVDIGMPAFDVHYMSRLGSPFLKAAITPKFFGIAGLAFAVSVVLMRKCKDGNLVLFSVIVTGYLVLYVVHARHYWFALGQEVQPIEMVRYLYSLTPLVCLVAGGVISNCVARAGEHWRRDKTAIIEWAAVLLIVLGVGVAQVTAVATMDDIASQEDLAWRGFLKTVASRQNDVFVSSRIVALQAYVGASVELVDVVALGDPRLRPWLTQLKSEGRITLLDDGHCGSAIARDRWPQGCAMVKWLAE